MKPKKIFLKFLVAMPVCMGMDAFWHMLGLSHLASAFSALVIAIVMYTEPSDWGLGPEDADSLLDDCSKTLSKNLTGEEGKQQ